MVGKMGKKLRFVLATTLSLIMLITPLSSALAAAKLAQKSSPSYVELKGKEVGSLIEEALSSTEVKGLLTEMGVEDLKVNVSDTKALRWNYNNLQGDVLILSSKEPKEIKLLYSISNGTIKTGAGITQSIDGKQTVDVYDVVDGKVYQTSNIESDGKEVKAHWKKGPFADAAKKSSGDVVASISSYTLCSYACNMIWTGGCGVSGWFMCNVICVPYGGPTCPFVCGLVWAFMCTTGTFINCDWMCRDLGFYP